MLIGLLVAAPVLVTLFTCTLEGYCRTDHSGDTPLGTALALDPAAPKNISASQPPAPGCPTPAQGVDYCESAVLVNATSGLGTDGVRFQLQDASGQLIPFLSVVLLDPLGGGLAQYLPNGIQGGSWSSCTVAACHAPDPSVPRGPLPITFRANETLVLEVGSLPVGKTLHGDTWIAIGQGAFSGTVIEACS